MASPKRPQCTRIAVSYYVESSFGVAFNDSAITKLFPPNEPVLLDLSQTREDDSTIIKGHEFAVDTDADVIVAQDVSMPFTFRGYLNLLGWLFSLITGTDSVTGTGTAYSEHTFKIQDACVNDQPPSTNVITSFVGDTASYYKMKGMCLNELKIAIDKPGVPTVSGTFLTDGTVTCCGATYTPPTSITAADVLAGIYSDFLTANYGATLASKKSLFMGADFTVNQNLDVADGRLTFADGSKYLKNLRFGNRVVTLVVKVQGHQGDEFWVDFLAKTPKVVQLSCTLSASRSLVIDIPKATIASIKQSFNGIRDMNEITYKAYFETTGSLNSPFKVTIRNGDAAYLLPVTAGM
jgi:hypothetical protein